MPKLVNEGENRILNILFGSTSVDSNLYLGLYMDTSEPAETASLSDLTEPSGNGYARIQVQRGSWSITNDVAEYAEQTFQASGGDWGDVYGYFIGTSTDDSGKLLFVEDFSGGPFTINDGSSIKVTPKVTAS